ncbi:iron-sulfur cluster assembly accessory protein [Paracoccaceae bacterium]|jgi:iron-sulfur cluster assembly accessory protein|nr:iron-sulfur cluster assembly accessory protein [Paracoccaceae bacterium]MBC8408504.1 iron-sulfur cluster assembly accessory protein [Paracoccaceae bacterium]MBT4285471.1 iron-sulfur cluster assembly accessory protein [Paracoccaceae bacterium]MBT4776634.1 iron-sulfur cluster assembly accessory protein [Paracoccaceae bacterium]MBT6270847.1 iron-sulfur cluster assembly accessory protein [Paracoccaceae bacterium]|tara:strand:+ start:358 stop:687 length:330 start_codon:yes stop_codon:yes gene_type:complete
MNLTLPPKITDRAFSRLNEIGAGKQSKALRIAVEGGGCSGFQYEIKLDDISETDWVSEKDGESVVIDSISLPFLENSIIDFSEELIGAKFTIDNPNAKTSCGCGTSFSI